MVDAGFIFIDDEQISCSQFMAYLASGGIYEEVIETVLEEHAIAKALQEKPELIAAEADLGRVRQTFRRERDLEDKAVFDAWLEQNDVDPEALDISLLQEQTLQQLVEAVTATDLFDYFNQHHQSLEQIYLSCIAVEDEIQAQELYDQIVEGIAQFEDLARDHSLWESRISGGALPAADRGSLPAELLAEIDKIQPGQVIEPLGINGQWLIVRLGKKVSAELDDALAARLKQELFQQWLSNRVDTMTIKIEVSEWQYL